MMRLSLVAFLFFVSTLSAVGQFSGPNPITITTAADQRVFDPVVLDSLLHEPYPKLTLRANDVVQVNLYGVKDFDVTRRVTSEGTISLPLVGDIPAAGYSVEEVASAAEMSLKKAGMLVDPQVTVTTVSQPSNVVTVSGAVAKPGVYPANGQLTLMDYLSLAGGALDTPVIHASSIITLIRPSLPGPVSVPLGPNPKVSPYSRLPIFGGDELRIGETGMVYAVGAFRSQGGFLLRADTPTTVTEVVGMAGGIGYEADYGDAHIVRNTSDGRVLISLNIKGILKGTAPDIALQGDDIVFVPTNLMKAAIKGGGANIIAGLATSLFYKY